MVRRLGLGKNNHLTYASLALNPRYYEETRMSVIGIFYRYMDITEKIPHELKQEWHYAKILEKLGKFGLVRLFLLYLVLFRTLHYHTHHYTILSYLTLHYHTFHYTILHYLTLHYHTFHYTCIILHCPALYYHTLIYIILPYLAPHYHTINYIILHYLSCSPLSFTQLYYAPLSFSSLSYTPLYYSPLSCSPLSLTQLY